MAASNVMNEILNKRSNDEINACLGGLNMFCGFISLDDEEDN